MASNGTVPVTHSPASARRVELDFLRGVAILLVLGHHLFMRSAGRLTPFYGVWNRLGWTGVDLFFVLSGFLVGGLLFQELKKTGQLNARRFIIRRGFKIWPSYYVYLGYLFVRMLLVQKFAVSAILLILLPNLLHVQNYNNINTLPNGKSLYDEGLTLVHTWSLAVEEHFYLLLPLALLWLTSRGPAALSKFPRFVGGIALLCLFLRSEPLHWHYAHMWGTWATHLRLDSLLFGVLLAYLFHFQPEQFARLAQRRRWFAAPAVLIISLICVLGETHRFTQTLGFTLLYLAYGGILIASVCEHTPGELRFFQSTPARGVAYIGLFSYSIYLWHMITTGIFLRWVGRSDWLMTHLELRSLIVTAIFLVVAIVPGIVLWRLLERPSLMLREKLFPAQASR